MPFGEFLCVPLERMDRVERCEPNRDEGRVGAIDLGESSDVEELWVAFLAKMWGDAMPAAGFLSVE